MIGDHPDMAEAFSYPSPSFVSQASRYSRLSEGTLEQLGEGARIAGVAQPAGLAFLDNVADAPHVGGHTGWPAANASISATGAPSLRLDSITTSRSARAEAMSSHQPVKCTRRDFQVRESPNNRSRSSPSPSTARWRPGNSATAAKAVAWSLIGTSLPMTPASGTSLPSLSA